jgi:hypothetical protein
VEGADLVVKGISALVKAAQGGLQHLLHGGAVQEAVLGKAGGDFQQVQGPSRVSIGGPCQAQQIGLCQRQGHPGLCQFEDTRQLLFREAAQSIDPGPGKQRRVQLEGGVFCGGPDEGQRAVLHEGQEGVLLSLVETVYLVDEEHALATSGAFTLPHGDGFTDRLDAIHDRRQRQHPCICCSAQEPRQGGLADARRTPEDH